MISSIVYLLCAFMSWVCAVLLLRAYARQRTRLLFWTGAGFCAFGVSNIMLFVDLSITPYTDLSLLRNGITLLGICLLLWGLIWESSSR
jgi:hypothetical protein